MLHVYIEMPAFGPRVSISAKAGGSDIMGKRKDGSFGAFSGSGKLEKQSLSEELQHKLNETGVAVVPLPEKAIKREKLDMKVCKQYALNEYAGEYNPAGYRICQNNDPFLRSRHSEADPWF